MSRVGIVDGNNLAWRSLLASPDRLSNKAGEETTLIYKFLRSIERYVSSQRLLLTDLVVVWDAGKDEEKLAMFPDYKGHRRRDDEEWEDIQERFYLQREILAQNFLPSMGIPQLSIKGIEADDIIYWLTRKYHEGTEFVVMSSDKDLLQCIKYADVYRLGKKESGDDAVFIRRNSTLIPHVGVPYSQYVLYRAIVGDASDNIPGLRGVGPVTALKLLGKHPAIRKPAQLIEALDASRIDTKGLRGIVALSEDGEARETLIKCFSLSSLAHWYVKRHDRIDKALNLARNLRLSIKFQNLAGFEKLCKYYAMNTLLKNQSFKAVMRRFALERQDWIRLIKEKSDLWRG